MNSPTNQERIGWAETATRAYMTVCPTDDCDALCDLLTDLMHKAKADGEIFDKELERAQMHFEAEQNEEPITLEDCDPYRNKPYLQTTEGKQ